MKADVCNFLERHKLPYHLETEALGNALSEADAVYMMRASRFPYPKWKRRPLLHMTDGKECVLLFRQEIPSSSYPDWNSFFQMILTEFRRFSLNIAITSAY